MVVNTTITIEGVQYEFGKDGVLKENKKEGWSLEEGKYYYYQEGRRHKGWLRLSGEYYYFDNTGVMQTGWQTIGGQTYYFYSSGSMLTGWLTQDNKKYYFYPSGSMVVCAQVVVEGMAYYFDAKGICYSFDELIPIYGISQTTVEKMTEYYINMGKKYPAIELGKGGAPTIEQFCQIFFDEANKEGIRAEVAFSQTMIETGYLQFGGDVKIEQFNFAGMGATGNGAQGNSFPDVRTGIRAQIQHLKCYANNNKLNFTLVDPRWSDKLREKAPYVEWLSIPNNPYGTGWAGDPEYAIKLKKIMSNLI